MRNILGRYLYGCFWSNAGNGGAFLSRCFDNWLFGDRSSGSVYDLGGGLSSGLSRGHLGDRSFLSLRVFRLIVTTNSFVVGTAPHAVGLCIFN